MNHSLNRRWQSAIHDMPLIAILRGLSPESCLEIGHALINAGFKIIEVPLNSPKPYQTLSMLSEEFGDKVIIGAGTVLQANQVDKLADTGCNLIIAPNLDLRVAKQTEQHNLIYCPGVLTPTEAFSAIEHGASGLKLFPAEMISPTIVRALCAVLPGDVPLFPVGGISPHHLYDYLQAGANGFGIGSAVFKPDYPASKVHAAAIEFVHAYQQAIKEEIPIE